MSDIRELAKALVFRLVLLIAGLSAGWFLETVRANGGFSVMQFTIDLQEIANWAMDVNPWAYAVPLLFAWYTFSGKVIKKWNGGKLDWSQPETSLGPITLWFFSPVIAAAWIPASVISGGLIQNPISVFMKKDKK